MTRSTYRAGSALPSKLLAGCTIGLFLVATGPCLGAESDGPHAPLLDTNQAPLDFAFDGPFENTPADDPVLCTVPCSSPDRVISSAPDSTPNYKQDFSLGLGRTGPVSFEFADSRLRMELVF